MPTAAWPAVNGLASAFALSIREVVSARSSLTAFAEPANDASRTALPFSCDGGDAELNTARPDRARGAAMDKVDWLEAMAEGSDDGFVVLGPGGDVVGANRAAERFTGLRREALVGRRPSSLGAESDFPWSVAGDAVTHRRAVSVVHTTRHGTKLLVAGKPVLAPAGTVQHVVVSVRDISELSRLVASLARSHGETDRYRRELRMAELHDRQATGVIGAGPAMQAARELAVKYAAVDSPVLLLGETGTGKGVFARLIHQASPRAAGPFLELNCGALPEALIEAELFGYARGAFTGADARGKPGLVELAHGGTLLLDEIGDLPPAIQVKLLRLLEEGEIWPVGAVRSRRPDLRILAATNRDLGALMAAGAFRPDLYYRLNVLALRLPPLRDRREDIPELVAMILERLAGRLRRRVAMAPGALAVVGAQDFPGNVRELWNLVERLAVTADRDVIEVEHLHAQPAPPAATEPDAEPRLRRTLEQVEAALLRDALGRYGSQALAGAHLGLSQATVARRAKRYGLSPSGSRPTSP
jgi:PAS domain S-box-containing protein